MNSVSKLFITRALTHPHSKRVLSFVDQGLIGISAVVINVFLARHFSVTTFASVTVMIGLHYFIQNVHRSLIVLPFILDDSGAPEEDVEVRRRGWWTANLAFTGVAVVLLGSVAILLVVAREKVPSISWVIDAAIYLSLTTPPLLAFEYGRRVLYQSGRSAAVALSSLGYLSAGVFVAAVGASTESELVGALAFAAAGAVGFVVFVAAVRPKVSSLREAWNIWKPHAEFGVWQAMTSIPHTIYAVSPVVLIGGLAGPIAAAVYGAARTIVSPAFSMVSAVDSMDKPRAARAMAQQGFTGLHASISRTRILLFALTGGYLGLVALFAPLIMFAAFGDRYAEHTDAVRVLALSFLCMCLNQPVETMMVVLRKVRALFVVRTAAAIAITIGIWLGAAYANALGAIVATAAVQFLVLVILLALEFMTVRRYRKSGGHPS